MGEPEPDRTDRPPPTWWYVAVLLAMFFVLMVSHIGVLWVGVAKCNEYTDLRIRRFELMQERMASSLPVPDEIKASPICSGLAQEFSSVAQLYMATILALISGAGFSVGVQSNGSAKRPKQHQRSDTP